jgi:uncharacterized protein YbjT (DUF2867 family)
MLVITGSTGQIGSQVLFNLLEGEEPIRVIVRDPAKLPQQVRHRVEIVQGSYAEPEVVAKAFDGAQAVFWVPIAAPTALSAKTAFLEMSRPAAEAIRRRGVTHVVSVSALGRGWSEDAGHATASIQMDDLLAETGASFRALACPTLMDNMLRQTASIRNQGVFYGPSPGGFRAPQVATRDVAAVAASLLRERSWEGARDLPLLGPEDISCNDQARIMSEVLGRPVTFRELSMTDLKGMMLGRGASEGMAQAMVNMATAKNAGLDLMIPRSPESATPTSFRAWCDEVLRPALSA